MLGSHDIELDSVEIPTKTTVRRCTDKFVLTIFLISCLFTIIFAFAATGIFHISGISSGDPWHLRHGVDYMGHLCGRHPPVETLPYHWEPNQGGSNFNSQLVLVPPKLAICVASCPKVAEVVHDPYGTYGSWTSLVETTNEFGYCGDSSYTTGSGGFGQHLSVDQNVWFRVFYDLFTSAYPLIVFGFLVPAVLSVAMIALFSSPYIKPKLGVQCSWGAVVSLGGFLFGFGCTLVGTGLVNTIAPQKAAWALVDTEVKQAFVFGGIALAVSLLYALWVFIERTRISRSSELLMLGCRSGFSLHRVGSSSFFGFCAMSVIVFVSYVILTAGFVWGGLYIVTAGELKQHTSQDTVSSPIISYLLYHADVELISFILVTWSWMWAWLASFVLVVGQLVIIHMVIITHASSDHTSSTKKELTDLWMSFVESCRVIGWYHLGGASVGAMVIPWGLSMAMGWDVHASDASSDSSVANSNPVSNPGSPYQRNPGSPQQRNPGASLDDDSTFPVNSTSNYSFTSWSKNALKCIREKGSVYYRLGGPYANDIWRCVCGCVYWMMCVTEACHEQGYIYCAAQGTPFFTSCLRAHHLVGRTLGSLNKTFKTSDVLLHLFKIYIGIISFCASFLYFYFYEQQRHSCYTAILSSAALSVVSFGTASCFFNILISLPLYIQIQRYIQAEIKNFGYGAHVYPGLHHIVSGIYQDQYAALLEYQESHGQAADEDVTHFVSQPSEEVTESTGSPYGAAVEYSALDDVHSSERNPGRLSTTGGGIGRRQDIRNEIEPTSIYFDHFETALFQGLRDWWQSGDEETMANAYQAISTSPGEMFDQLDWENARLGKSSSAGGDFYRQSKDRFSHDEHPWEHPFHDISFAHDDEHDPDESKQCIELTKIIGSDALGSDPSLPPPLYIPKFGGSGDSSSQPPNRSPAWRGPSSSQPSNRSSAWRGPSSSQPSNRSPVFSSGSFRSSPTIKKSVAKI